MGKEKERRIKRRIKEVGEKMKLKTLEDFKIEGFVHSGKPIPFGMVEIPASISAIFEAIKQEAIKWVKERRSKCEFALCKKDHLPCEDHQFWMERFNITEEDLE